MNDPECLIWLIKVDSFSDKPKTQKVSQPDPVFVSVGLYKINQFMPWTNEQYIYICIQMYYYINN